MKNASRIALGLALVTGLAFAGCSNANRTTAASSSTEVKAKSCCAEKTAVASEKAGCCKAKAEASSCSDKAATCTDKK